MDLDLSNIRAKLARSQEHIQTLNGEIRLWTERHPYSLHERVNADHTRYSLIVRINEPPPFQRWTLIFADALTNLRSALDYLVYAVAVAQSGAAPPPFETKLQFPIADTKATFDERVRTKWLGSISDPVIAKFESFQPYNRPHPTLPPLLAVLRDLNNADKHRLIRLTYGSMGQANIGFVGDFPQDGREWKLVPNTGEIKDCTEVMAMACNRSTPNMRFDRHIIDVIVAVWHSKRDPSATDDTGRTEVSALYSAISQETRRAIYEITMR
jgi:hypothetical protein